MLVFFRYLAKCACGAAFLMLVLAPLAQAAGLAVVDSRKVLQESIPAKAYAKNSEEGFRKRINKIKDLEAEVKKQEEKLKRDGLTMSELDKSMAGLDLRHKEETIRFLSQLLSRDKANADRAELERLSPVLDKAIQEVAVAAGYDLVVEKEAVRFSRSGVDITGKVIEKLNHLAK
ncbi:MAG: OmpH family outer membrane protein [Kistimonas sp.]|nr:OmpH family outer membrane protein [Kistimonas sp.]